MNLAQIEVIKSKLLQWRKQLARDRAGIKIKKSFQDDSTKLNTIDTKLAQLSEIMVQVNKQALLIRIFAQINNTNIDKTIARNFTKAFKHEFLTQMKDYNISLSDLIQSTLAYLPENPGINIENYVLYLYLNGYFTFSSPVVTSEDLKQKSIYELEADHLASDACTVQVTDKALRYLENEANVSLRRAKHLTNK